MAGNLQFIRNLAGFHAFLIKCDSLDQPELFYKKSILDLQWLSFDDNTSQGIFLLIRLTYKDIQLLKEIPDGIPEVLPL